MLLLRVVVTMSSCTNRPEDDFHKTVCACVRACTCVYYRLYILLKLFILYKESLLRILLMLEIFLHWVEFSLARPEWRGMVSLREKTSNETMDVSV